MGFDKDLLFKDALPEAEVDLPGKGTVRVRALTRGEVLHMRQSVKSVEDAIKRQGAFEARTLAKAMLDPEMSVAEVEMWQERSVAGEIDLVIATIEKISGLLDDPKAAAKKVVMEFEADPEAEFRLPPG